MLALFLALLLPLPLDSAGTIYQDPSLATSASGALNRLAAELHNALAAQDLPLPALPPLASSLGACLYSGEPLLFPLPPTPYILRAQPASTPLGALLRALRCEAGWGSGGCAAGGAAQHKLSPSLYISHGLNASMALPPLVADAAATQRLRAALWARRMEYCELADMLAPDAVSLLLPADVHASPAWRAAAAQAAAGALETRPRSLLAEFGGVHTAAASLGACVLRRLRNAGGQAAGIVTPEGATLPTTQESLLFLLLGGTLEARRGALLPQQPCSIVTGFDSALVRLVRRQQGLGGDEGPTRFIGGDDGSSGGVGAPSAAAGLVTAKPLPRAQKRGGLFIFTSEEDIAGADSDNGIGTAAAANASPTPTPTPVPAAPTAEKKPLPLTLWHALLEDLQALRATEVSAISQEGYSHGTLQVTAAGPPSTSWSVPAYLPQCTQDAGIHAMLRSLVEECQRGALPPLEDALAIELTRHTSRLMLAELLAGDGQEFDVGACLRSAQASAPASPPPAGGAADLPLIFCLPTSQTASTLCRPSAVWGSPRPLLVPYWHDMSSTTATLMLTHPRVASTLRQLLHYALAVGDIAGWHPSGISPVESPDLLFSPQHMFYFASSYFFVHLEKEYKNQLHRRMAGALGRLRSYASTQYLLVDASVQLRRLTRFNFALDAARAGAAQAALGAGLTLEGASAAVAAVGAAHAAAHPDAPVPSIPIHGRGVAPPCAREDSPRLLVFSSYWDKGHSSHRITAPLSRSLATYTCAYLVHAVTEELWETSRTGEAVSAPGSPAALTLGNLSDAAKVSAWSGGRARYEESAGFADVETFPLGESLPLQLALWALLRSRTQWHGTRATQVELHGGNESRWIDSEFMALGSEDYAAAAAAPLDTSLPPRLHTRLPFDAVLYPSIGMSPNDMTLSSLRVARVQMVTYGHSSSTQSPVMDVFLGGVEPEVLGPLTADVYAFTTSCLPGVEALNALLRVALKDREVADATEAYPAGGSFIGTTDVSSALRLPRVAVCSGEAVLGYTASGGAHKGPLNDTLANAPVNQMCATLNSYYIPSSAPLGTLPLATLLPSLLPPGSPTLSPRCKTSFPLNMPAAPALYTRLIDAQRRYSERLLLLPGLGLWFTSVFPAYAPPLRILPNTSSPALSHALGREALHLGAALLGLLCDAAPGAVEGELEAQAVLLKALLGGHSRELQGALESVLQEPSIPWPGAFPHSPIEISLVWSVVKWNGRHLDRLLVALHAAQARWALAWSRCLAVVGKGGVEAEAGGSSGDGGPRRWSFEPAPPSTTPTLPPPLATAFSTHAQAALRSVCQALLQRFPPSPPNPSAPSLFFRIVAFSTSDGDALKGAAFRAWLRRVLAAEFPGGYSSLLFITNATTPAAYYGRLGATHLAFDSLPFSACNTMQDVLALRVPTISAAHDGEYEPGSATALRWRSSIGACMLTRLGLSGLAAEGEEDLVGKASHLVANPLLRAVWKLRMDEADEGELARRQYADRDAQLVANMIKRHE